jgi:Sulfotransferase family
MMLGNNLPKTLAKITPPPIVRRVTPGPFFIIGFQRSGTTLLRMMFDNHPQVAIPLDVTGLWNRYYARLGQYDLARDDGVRRLIADLLAEERIKLWQTPLTVEQVLERRTLPGYPGIVDAFYAAYAAHRGKTRWGDKDPGNILRINDLNRWFPDARIVHIIRDGRGACLSHLDQAFGHDDLLACAEAWREEVWWVRQIGDILGPSRYCEVKYEDLVAAPERELRRLCRFLDLEFAPEMLAYHTNIDQSIPSEKRHIWPLIDQPPRKENADKWRDQMSRGTRICFEKRAGSLLRELGYETTPPPWRGAYGTEIRHFLAAAFRVVRARSRRVT